MYQHFISHLYVAQHVSGDTPPNIKSLKLMLQYDIQTLDTYCILDVCGSVHHSKIRKENPTRYNSVSKFYFTFICSSTCFGRNTSQHQEPKTNITITYTDTGHVLHTRCFWIRASYSQRKSNKTQKCNKILFHIYMKLNMFRATHRPS